MSDPRRAAALANQADRVARMKRKYGVSDEVFGRMWTFQNGKCFICHKPFSSNRLACIDHRHEDGLVRGLLCTPCNDFIGRQHDNADMLRRAANYIDNPPAECEHIFVPGSIGDHRAGG